MDDVERIGAEDRVRDPFGGADRGPVRVVIGVVSDGSASGLAEGVEEGAKGRGAVPGSGPDQPPGVLGHDHGQVLLAAPVQTRRWP